MSTKIAWTEETWNPTTGCDRTSPGCLNCYALTMAGRLKAMGQPKYQADGDPRTSGPGFALTLHPDKLDEPLHWRASRRIFVDSMSDLFHPDVPTWFLTDVFHTMYRCPQHTFQILTKRAARMARFADDLYEAIGQPPLPNVWLGTSIETDSYTFRASHLRATPAAVRFLSLEPLREGHRGQLGSLPRRRRSASARDLPHSPVARRGSRIVDARAVHLQAAAAWGAVE